MALRKPYPLAAAGARMRAASLFAAGQLRRLRPAQLSLARLHSCSILSHVLSPNLLVPPEQVRTRNFEAASTCYRRAGNTSRAQACAAQAKLQAAAQVGGQGSVER